MKNMLRSVFISLFPVFALYITIDSIWHMADNGFSWRYTGRLVAALAVVAFFGGLFIAKRARTQRNPKVYTVLIFVGFLMSVALGGILENGEIIGSSTSLAIVLGWILYLKWYSVFDKRESENLKVGQQLPDFSLKNSSKETVAASSFLGNPSIFLFYRGNWCPLCMAQIKEVAEQYQELEKRGVDTILVSPQPHKYTASLAKKFDVGFHFLVDENNEVATKLGIDAKNGIPAGFQVLGYDSDTAMPTVIITDKEGKIIFADLTDNYRVRPEPETFLKVLDQKYV